MDQQPGDLCRAFIQVLFEDGGLEANVAFPADQNKIEISVGDDADSCMIPALQQALADIFKTEVAVINESHLEVQNISVEDADMRIAEHQTAIRRTKAPFPST